MERITHSLFIRLLTNQPYFVWNKILTNDEKEEEHLKFDIASYKDVIDTSFSEVQAKSFYLIEMKFEKKVASRFQNSYFIREKNIERKIQKTKWALENKNIDYIINPVFNFIYKNFQILAQPSYFSKKTKKIGFLKISTSTRLKDILRFMFDYMVLKELNFEINDVELHVLKTKEYKKGEVDFYKTRFINTTKSCRSTSNVSDYDYDLKQLIKTGQSYDKNGKKLEKPIIEILQSGQVYKGFFIFRFSPLKTYLHEIIAAKQISKILPPTSKDASRFENSPNWDSILEKTKNKWLGYSGKIVNKKAIIDDLEDWKIFKKAPVAQYLKDNKIVIWDRFEATGMIWDLESKVVWYDFESMSLPFAPMDYLLPFGQLVTQVSIITTNNLKEEEVSNIVIDPKSIEPNDFIKIINKIYKKGYKYVVYNKAYENTRLQEMIRILELTDHKEYYSLSKKVAKIIDNTIDLADFFACSAKKMPLILIPFLKGKYSIKLIEKFISQSNLSLPYQIKEYKNLEVQNGLKAMEIANNRALGIIGDKQWSKITKSLKEYCENDVRAMIMVYYLVKKLLEIY